MVYESSSFPHDITWRWCPFCRRSPEIRDEFLTEEVSPRDHHRNGFGKVDQGRSGSGWPPWTGSVVSPVPPFWTGGHDRHTLLAAGDARRYRPSRRSWDGTSEPWPQSFGNTLADGCGNGCLPRETTDEGRWAWCKKPGILTTWSYMRRISHWKWLEFLKSV